MSSSDSKTWLLVSPLPRLRGKVREGACPQALSSLQGRVPGPPPQAGEGEGNA
jgi:hypothetical protein